MPTPARWLLPRIHEAEVEQLSRSVPVSRPAARVLWRRGYRDADSARRFLEAPLEDLHDPLLMKGMPVAVERLRRAISAGERILLYGDYDVDGATSIVLLKKAIEMAGGAAQHYVPDRLTEGYGIRTEVIEQAAAAGVSLVISVDTGIRAAEPVERARALGLDVIVTDHHLPETDLPPAFAILNPKQPGCAYPEKDLCGAGVTLKLVHAFLQALGWPTERLRRVLTSMLKMAAIATVADVVPLTGENRIIVKHGLAGLASVRNPGLRALLEVAGFSSGEAPSAGQVAFRLAPRLNAAGRMASANDVVRLFLTEDEQQARQLAEQLHALNQERQATEARIIAEILEECARTPVGDDQAALVFAGTGWHPGVIGIVANRLVDRFHRPAIVLSIDPETRLARGSGRSTGAFHLLEALEATQDLLLRFGGHKQAAGLSLPADRIDELRGRLNRYAAERLRPEDLLPAHEFDARLRLDEITPAAVEDIFKLAPFGFGNPAPLFLIEEAEIVGEPSVYAENHLRVRLRQNGRLAWVKGWNFRERAGELVAGSRIDAAIQLEADEQSAARGFPGWCLSLRDVR